MASTTLTTKGQMTLPKAIRDRLNLKPGDRLEVSTDGDRIVITPKTLDLDDLCAILPRPKHVVTLDEIDAAIRRRAIRNYR
jgi:AbrB family looped-hinge helix DNA binding protein